MTILYFFTLLMAVPFLIFPFLKEKHGAFMWIGTILGANILFAVGTFKSCVSGWISSSIGSRGACSHHGGVTSNMNDIGYIILALSLLFLLVKFVIYQNKNTSDETINIKEITSVNEVKEFPDIPHQQTKFQGYDKYISVWHNSGLSIEDIVVHLRSKNVFVSSQDVREYIEHKHS
ncbi:hypothetical protein [Colwellia psychrerythraea]|uniref:hypothetical protein n=1 Tax=Colwellia psychrerythraea TaxID=28229 RepID=UPI0005A01A27|nr:hypothetical protein [Colwellia psychrerythraea]